jgi:hypothetical protein
MVWYLDLVTPIHRRRTALQIALFGIWRRMRGCRNLLAASSLGALGVSSAAALSCDACDAGSPVCRFIRLERRGSSLGSSLSAELLVELCLELSLSLSLSSWYCRELAQRRQLCFRRRLCLALAVAALGISHYLGCPEVVLVMLVLCSSTLSTFVSFLLLCSFSACHSSFPAGWELPFVGSTKGSSSVNGRVLRLAVSLS